MLDVLSHICTGRMPYWPGNPEDRFGRVDRLSCYYLVLFGIRYLCIMYLKGVCAKIDFCTNMSINDVNC
jgi:hypothetical protein